MNEGLGYLTLLAVAIIASMTNRTKKDHLHAISDQNSFIGWLVELGSGFGGLNYNNYVIASTLSIDGKKSLWAHFKIS